MNRNIHLMWPDGLAVWFFLRIFKHGYKIWERSWVQFPVRPFFLSPRSVSHAGIMFADQQNRSRRLFTAIGRCIPSLEISHDHTASLVSTPINTNQHSFCNVVRSVWLTHHGRPIPFIAFNHNHLVPAIRYFHLFSSTSTQTTTPLILCQCSTKHNTTVAPSK